MKRFSVVFFALILGVAFEIHAQGTAGQEDATFRDAIAKDAKAERPRYDYSYYLYTKKRFKDAREQLKFLFGINSQHVGGRKLLRSMDDVDGLVDTQYQEQQMRLFMIEKMKLDKQEEAEAANRHGGSLTPERITRIQGELDKRYSFSDRMKLEVKLGDDEVKFQDNFAASLRGSQYGEAEKVARNWVNNFEKSPIAKADFGAFLILRDRFVQAEVLLSDAIKKNPECLKLKIVADILKDIKTVKSSEKTADLKGRLTDELAVYQLAANGQLEEAKRAPSGGPTTATPPAKSAPTIPNATPPAPGVAETKQPETVGGLPAVITPADIEKMNVAPTGTKIQRRQ